MIEATPAASSVLAFVTTIHAGVVVLRLHRGGVRSLALAMPSCVCAALTWVLATPLWLAVGLATNIAWYAACETVVSRTAGARPGNGRATGFVPVPVLAVHDECERIRTLRLGRPPGFEFRAGQFLTVQARAGGRPHVRCYSISSPPDVPGYLEISVRRQGVVSGWLHRAITPGSTLLVRAPAGRFVYPAGDDRPLVLLAGGVGITPLMSMIRHALITDVARPLTLLYSVKQTGDVAYRDELARLARRHPQLRVLITITGKTTVEDCRRGRIDEPLITDTVPDPVGAVFMICGPAPMIDATRTLLLRLGVPPEQVRSEAFEAAAAVGARPPSAAATATSAARTLAACGQLTLARTNLVIKVARGESLLDAAEKGGADIPSLCRAGVCGTCRTRLLSGEATCTSQALAESDRGEGYVLPCVTWAEGDCVLEA